MRRKLSAAALGVAALTLAGCSADVSDVVGLRPTPAPPPGVFTASVVAADGVLTDAEGHVLYRSDADRRNAARSTCFGACAETWPPVLTDGSPALDGVDPSRIGNLLRPDATRQLTIDGWPVHRSTKPRAPRLPKTWHPLEP